MNLIRQCTRTDCGIAVAAMLCNVPYHIARNASSNPDPTRGLLIAELIETCRRLGATIHVSRPSKYQPITAALDPCAIAALIARTLALNCSGHWIAIERGQVLDPERGRFYLPAYERRAWFVMRNIYRV